MTIETLGAAQLLLRDGYSIIPVARAKKPAIAWAPYMLHRADEQTVQQWYTSSSGHGIGIVCGHVSSQLLVLDVESEDAWLRLLDTVRLGADQHLVDMIETSSLSITPSGGRHLLMHLDYNTPPGTVLARTAAGNVLIETRGQGHYIVAAGSPEHVHPTNILYRWDRYIDPESRALWSAPHVYQILTIAQSQHAHVPPAQRADPVTRVPGAGSETDAPGQVYNSRGSWDTLLSEAGWTLVSTRGESQYWRRPGKRDGISATVGHCRNDKAEPLMYVFSSSASHLEAGRAYSLFAARTAMRHGGDYGDCARALYRDGYKSEQVTATLRVSSPDTATSSAVEDPVVSQSTPDPVRRHPDGRERRYLLTSELPRTDPAMNWLWYGCIRRGAATMISAHPKVGKTTLISHLLRSLQDGGEFLGLTTQPARVLVLTEEDGPTIAERADIIGIGDHVAWYVRPFTSRPTMVEWREWVAATVQDCIDHRADLLIVDTLMRNMPLRDENNATEIDDALLPLWKLMETGVAIVVIHHLKKGGGPEGTGARGSSALMAWPEVTFELSRTNPDDVDCRQRTLRSNSRFRQTPVELVIELGDEGYTVCGSLRDAEARGIHTAITHMLAVGEPMSHYEIATAMGRTRQTIESHLARMVDAGVLRRTGTGTRGDIHRYTIAGV
jgi:hypothetical protein